MNSVGELAEKYNIHKVDEHAARLSEVCPVARVNPDFSPSQIAMLASGKPDKLLASQLIWECLACGLCKITADVNMSYFIRDSREKASKEGYFPTHTHGGMFISAQRLSTNPERFKKSYGKPRRNNWLEEDLKVESETGKYLFWAGGASFFDAAMPELELKITNSARFAVRLLNTLGIKPVVLENERFSGHDLLWTGDREGFKQLAEQNIKAITKSKARVVVSASPEDYYTLSKSYPEFFGDLDFKVLHITEILAQKLDRLKFYELKKRVTYHDSCRLGRGMGVYDPPRAILRAIPGIELVEMPTTREDASCCGTSCWIQCSRYSKMMQVNRLREATGVGAELLVSACWECTIHLRCAVNPKSWKQVFVPIEDLITLLSSLLRE
ncbi:MAG: (Fe-S)-binding protein [Spirochaetota bacterium]|nr:MAG: (Fe-S)-binding protein [Spirochaetota bacterium]